MSQAIADCSLGLAAGGEGPFRYARQSVARQIAGHDARRLDRTRRSEEHTSELQSLMRISYAVFCLKKKKSSKIKTPLHNTASIQPHNNNHRTRTGQYQNSNHDQ